LKSYKFQIRKLQSNKVDERSDESGQLANLQETFQERNFLEVSI